MTERRMFSRRRLLGTGLVGSVSALALAACGETVIERVEVPVEVIKEVQVAGETIVKEVEVPGATVIKEVIKEVEVTVEVEKIVEKIVIEQAPVVQMATVLDWVHPLSAEDMLVFQPLIDRFNSDVNPNIDIRIDIVPWSNRIQKTMGAVAAGAPPDTAYVNVDEFTTYVVQDVLEPLDDFIKADSVDLDDWLPGPRSGMDWEGKIYELPHLFAFRVSYYNKTIWEQSGLDPEVSPSNWSEHTEMLTRVMAAKAAGAHEAFGATYAALSHPVGIWNPYFYQAGGALLTADGKSAYNSPAGLEAAEKIIEIMENFADPAGKGSDGSDTRSSFGQERFAYHINDELSLIRLMETDYADVNYGLAETMTGNVKWTHGGLGNKCIFAGSKVKDATWEWIQFLAGAGNLEYNVAFGFVPPRKSIMEQYMIDPAIAANPLKLLALNEAQFARVEKAPGLWDMWDVLKPAIQAFVLGEKSPQEALDEAADRIDNDILDRYRGAVTG